MGEAVEVTSFHQDEGHVVAWVRLPRGPVAAFRWCPGQSEAVDAATAAYGDALARAVELVILESVPAVPDTPPAGILLPCRMCGAVRPDNAEDGRGFVWCGDHREYARDE